MTASPTLRRREARCLRAPHIRPRSRNSTGLAVTRREPRSFPAAGIGTKSAPPLPRGADQRSAPAWPAKRAASPAGTLTEPRRAVVLKESTPRRGLNGADVGSGRPARLTFWEESSVLRGRRLGPLPAQDKI